LKNLQAVIGWFTLHCNVVHVAGLQEGDFNAPGLQEGDFNTNVLSRLAVTIYRLLWALTSKLILNTQLDFW
jgi:hypothetical protein